MTPELHDENWFAAADPRSGLEDIRVALEHRLAAGQGCTAIVRALASRDALAAVELLVGPRTSPALARMALRTLPQLEGAVKPAALYRRLLDLLPERRREVLTEAAQRHPDARWLHALGVRAEGPAAGTIHLRTAVQQGITGEPLVALCRRYTVAGTTAGVTALARDGRLEALEALAREGAEEALVTAAAAALDADPSAAVVPLLTACWGTRPLALLGRVRERMRSDSARQALGPQLAWWPELTTD